MPQVMMKLFMIHTYWDLQMKRKVRVKFIWNTQPTNRKANDCENISFFQSETRTIVPHSGGQQASSFL